MGKYVDLSQTVTASYYDEEHEEWRFKQRTIEDLLDDICDSYSTVDAVPVSPCDACKYAPPSSCDGKPCTMCPAEGR